MNLVSCFFRPSPFFNLSKAIRLFFCFLLKYFCSLSFSVLLFQKCLSFFFALLFPFAKHFLVRYSPIPLRHLSYCCVPVLPCFLLKHKGRITLPKRKKANGLVVILLCFSVWVSDREGWFKDQGDPGDHGSLDSGFHCN